MDGWVLGMRRARRDDVQRAVMSMRRLWMPAERTEVDRKAGHVHVVVSAGQVVGRWPARGVLGLTTH